MHCEAFEKSRGNLSPYFVIASVARQSLFYSHFVIADALSFLCKGKGLFSESAPIPLHPVTLKTPHIPLPPYSLRGFSVGIIIEKIPTSRRFSPFLGMTVCSHHDTPRCHCPLFCHCRGFFKASAIPVQ